MVGKTISHYKILEKLGEGGMGVVYKAQDTKLDRSVALKFLPHHLSQSAEEKKRFIHEAKAASALDHPNICTIHEIDETEDGQMFIAMACYEGASLKDRIEGGPLGIDETLDIAIQMTQGLAKAHSKEIIHRDIKPANVLISEDSTIKIVDFGLAKLAGRTMLTKEGTTLGTIAYMSPEQTQGTEVDHRTDIWALGAVLFEMLSGEHPFKGDYEQAVMYSIMNEEPEPIKKVNPAVPPELEQIVNRALQKNPESRYSSAAEMLKDLKVYQNNMRAVEMGTFDLRTFLRRIRKPRVAVPAVGMILIIILGAAWFFNRQAKIRWARTEAIPEIVRQIDESTNNYGGVRGDLFEAYKTAEEAEKYIPNDSVLINLWPQFTSPFTIHTTPTGADVYRKDYSDVEGEWKYLGKSPIDSLRTPNAYYQWKIHKDGYSPVIFAAYGDQSPMRFELNKKESIPIGMVRVVGANSEIGLLNDFLIDKYEITNKQFKEFVDSGGYKKQEYWETLEYVKDGVELSWNEAIDEFHDATGRPGPAAWEVGNYPERKDDYPVTGISWFEAAAFAKFKGKQLPTIFHWKLAASASIHKILAQSNFNNEGKAKVGSYQGVSRWGVYDMAGNVREWCWNESKDGRYTKGGAWNDEEYLFYYDNRRSPFDRSLENGFRCVRYLNYEKVPKEALQPIYIVPRDYSIEKPVSDDIFQTYKNQFDYDPTELESNIDLIVQASDEWIKQTVSFNAAYGNERVTAYLFLPKGLKPPFQTVIYFPGGGAFRLRTNEEMNIAIKRMDFIIKSGRAFMFPIYYGSYERYQEGVSSGTQTRNSVQWAEYIVKCVKDIKRSIDYLETRSDIDLDRIAYFGFSRGSTFGTIISSVEARIQVAIFAVGGFSRYVYRPEVDTINYVSRVTVPVLLLNGKFDPLRPLKFSVIPYYNLLGTPDTDKRHRIYETGHSLPRNKMIKETLDFLDYYLGPVQ